MTTKIRLRRIGAKKAPVYRVVVTDSRNARDGRFIEEIGYYDPSTNPVTVKIDEEKVNAWLDKGAQTSDTCRALFKAQGIIAKRTAQNQK